MASELAAYYVSIVPSAKGLSKGIAKEFSGVDREASKSGKSSGRAFAGAFKAPLAGIAGAFAAVGIGSFVKDAVNAAGSLEQSVGAISSVFGSSAKDMQKWSKTAATNVGLTANEFNELGTLIGSQLKNGGTAMEDLAPKTKELIGMGADLSSMFGGTTKDAVDALSSALKGERDPIERYGVSLNQAKIDAEAAALGFEKVDGALSSEATQAATLSLIMKQTADAHGNFAKESDTFAHKQQVMAARWGDLKTRIGEVFMPVFAGAIGFFSEKAMPVITEVVGGMQAFGAAFGDAGTDVTSSGIAGFLERLGLGLGGIWALISKGDFNGKLRGAFGWEEDHPMVAGILTIRDAALGLYDLLVMGDFSPSVRAAFGWEEDHPMVSGILSIRDAALKVPDAVGAIGQKLWDMRVPIGIIAGLIVTVLIPHWIALGLEALKSAAKQKIAWLVARSEATKAAIVHSAAVTRMVAGWAAMATMAMVNAARIAASWLIAMGPVGWAVLAIGAIGGAIWAAYENVGWFRDGVDAAFKVAGDAAQNVGKWFTEAFQGAVSWWNATLLPAIGAVGKWFGDLFTNIGNWFRGFIGFFVDGWGMLVDVWNGVMAAFRVVGDAINAVFQGIYNFLKPTFDSIGVILGGFGMFFEGVFNLVVAIIQKIVIPLFMTFWTRTVEAFTAVGAAIGSWWDGVVAVFNTVVNYIRTVLSAAFTWFRDNVITPVWNAVTSVVRRAWANISAVFNAVISFIRTVLSAAFTWLRDNVINPVWNTITSIVRTAWNNISGVFNTVVSFIRTTFSAAFTWLRDNVIKPVWDGISSTIKNVWERNIKPVFDTLGKFIKETIPKAFETGVSAIKRAWEKIQDVAKAPVRFVINTVINDGLIAGFNNIARPLGVKELGRVALPAGFADGGYTGPGHKYKPAGIVHAGEYVFTKEQTQRAGVGNLAALAGSLTGYARGGIVNPLKQMALTQGYNRVHKGIDLAAAVGTPVFASQGGRVTWAGPGVSAPGVWGGNEIHIAGDGIETWFAHLSQIGVKLGQQVRAGQQIGLSGNTGISSGPHLHFGTFAGGWPNDIDPMAYLGGAGIPSGGGFNPIAGIIDGLMSKIKEAGGGPFADIAIGIGKKVIDGASKFITNFLSGNTDKKGSATATLYDGGGWLENTGGAQLVQHNKRKPDAVLSSSQWDTMTRIADNAKGGFNNYGTIHVRDEEEAARIILTRQRDAQAAYGF